MSDADRTLSVSTLIRRRDGHHDSMNGIRTCAACALSGSLASVIGKYCFSSTIWLLQVDAVKSLVAPEVRPVKQGSNYFSSALSVHVHAGAAMAASGSWPRARAVMQLLDA